MSAIWGIVSFHQPLEKEVKKMENPYHEACKLDRIHSISGSHFFFSCGLQFITQESLHEILPIEDDSCCFTADCLLDNRRELIQQLQIHENGKNNVPDGKLLYLAYKKWGISFLNKIQGMFSIAIYEKRTNKVFLAVDPVSSRCLYYHHTEEQIVFSTLMGSIRSLGFCQKKNDNYMKDFLVAPGLMPNIVPGETPYENLFQMLPGTCLTITKHGLQKQFYWTPSTSEKQYDCRNANDYGNAFKELYQKCVEDATRTCGNVGIALSSGLDSSTVGALAALHLQDYDKSLFTYTYIPYEENPALDSDHNHVINEKEDVTKLVEKYPNMIPHFLNNHGNHCLKDVSTLISILEIPFKAFVNMPNLYEIYQTAATHGCKILLNGQCGNSTVSNGYIDDVLYDLYHKKKYFTCIKWLNRYCKYVHEKRSSALKACWRYYHFADRQYQNNTFSYTPDNPFLSMDFLRDYPLQSRFELGNCDFLASVPTTEAQYHRNLWRLAMYTYIGAMETKLGLATGIIIRDPTRDSRMISFCYHLPYQYFAYSGEPRWLIRGNCKELLPSCFYDNWLRYGVQNIDWLLRIKQNSDDLLEEIRKTFREKKNNPDMIFYHYEEIENFLSISQNSPQWDETKWMYLLFLYIILLF